MSNKIANIDTEDEAFQKQGMRTSTKIILAGLTIGLVAADIYYIKEHKSKPKRNVLLPTEFTECDLIDVVQVTENTKFYKLKAKNSNDYPVPYHVVVKDDSCQVGRSYTPVSVSEFEIGLLVKKYEDGVVSKMLDGLKPGDLVSICGPRETMTPYVMNSVKELGMVFII